MEYKERRKNNRNIVDEIKSNVININFLRLVEILRFELDLPAIYKSIKKV